MKDANTIGIQSNEIYAICQLIEFQLKVTFWYDKRANSLTLLCDAFNCSANGECIYHVRLTAQPSTMTTLLAGVHRFQGDFHCSV